MSRTLAVFGGSFNPPHVGHALVASYVLCCCDVDALLVLPTAQHPFGKALAPFQHRMEMTRMTLRCVQPVTISDLEQRMGGQSHTLRTLQALKQEHPGHQLRLVVGSDILPSFPSWHRAPEVAALAPLLVIQRAGHRTPEANHGPALPQVSSTDIRQRIRAQASTSGLLAPEVASYITAHALYLDPTDI